VVPKVDIRMRVIALVLLVVPFAFVTWRADRAPSVPCLEVNQGVGKLVGESAAFTRAAVSRRYSDGIWLVGFPSELVSTYPDAAVFATDIDPVTAQGPGRFLPANDEAVRQLESSGRTTGLPPPSPELVAALNDDGAIGDVTECVEEKAQLSLS
jgi:hypothetical protein